MRKSNNISKRLKQISDNAKNLHGKNQDFSSDTLFHDEFMERNTNFKTFDEFTSKSSVEIENQDDFNQLENNQSFNDYVAKETRFSSWKEMVETAGAEQIAKQIFE